MSILPVHSWGSSLGIIVLFVISLSPISQPVTMTNLIRGAVKGFKVEIERGKDTEQEQYTLVKDKKRKARIDSEERVGERYTVIEY